jgi:tetratricopeptide (TPR) repeat protein
LRSKSLTIGLLLAALLLSCRQSEEYYRYTARYQQTLGDIAKELALDEKETGKLAEYNQLSLDAPLDARQQVRIPKKILSQKERKFMEALEQVRVYFTKEELPTAENLLRELVLEKPQMSGLYYQLGLVLWREGKDQEAYRYLTIASACLPNDPDVAYALGTVASKLGKDYSAVQYFLDALAVSDRTIYHYSLALAYHQLGMKEEADKELKLAIAKGDLPKILKERAEEYLRQMEAELAPPPAELAPPPAGLTPPPGNITNSSQ